MIRPDNPLIVQSDRSLMLHTVRAVIGKDGRAAKDEQERSSRISSIRAAERPIAAAFQTDTGVLAACDRLVELGPGGGEAGGRVISLGTPRELARDPASVTGPWLFLDGAISAAARAARPRPSPRPPARSGARRLAR